jgi:putative ABC transport system permease protein
LLAIFLACLGLFAMSAFAIGRRRKEMGVRKVFGASNIDTIILITQNFLTPVILANIISWPLAYYVLQRWLQSFAFRTNISIWSFVVAAISVTLITVLTISLHSRRVALQTPAVTLGTE